MYSVNPSIFYSHGLSFCKEAAQSFPVQRITWAGFKTLASIILIPYGLYKLVNSLALALIVPSAYITAPTGNENFKGTAQRLSFPVHGVGNIEGIIICSSSEKSSKWLLGANGNGELYQNLLGLSDRGWGNFPNPKLEYMQRLSPNVVLFNYPGVGNSEGTPTPDKMQKAYRAVLLYIENELQANEIIGYGFSLGGGVQATALVDHKLKENVKYVFTQDRSFSSLSNVATGIFPSCMNTLVRGLIWGLGLEMDSAKAIEKVGPNRFIILQKGLPAQGERKAQTLDDGVITEQAALSKVEGLHERTILIREQHCESLSEASFLELHAKVDEILSQ
ncbi:MAG: hypothetical protein NT065_06500 [Chlamydiae bacterium]|nr:hypothetical protein [Chlamydiota bacterium]